jgi:hypothetical protein
MAILHQKEYRLLYAVRRTARKTEKPSLVIIATAFAFLTIDGDA